MGSQTSRVVMVLPKFFPDDFHSCAMNFDSKAMDIGSRDKKNYGRATHFD